MSLKARLVTGAVSLCLSFGALAAKTPRAAPARAFFACVYQLNDPQKVCVPVEIKGVNQNENMELAPASLNKMMTAHMVLQHMKANGKTLDDAFVNVTHNDTAAGRIGERDGKTVTGGHVLLLPEDHILTYREMIHALTVYSANNAAVAAARAIAPDGERATFAEMMNAEARIIGMNDTILKTESGMPATGQKSSAEDMSKLVHHIVNTYGLEQFDELFGQSSAMIAGKKIAGHLRLLNNPAVVGGKTGADAEGLNVAGLAQRGGIGVVFTTMGSPSGPRGDRGRIRDSYTVSMLNKIFNAFIPSAEARTEPVAKPTPKKKKPVKKAKRVAPKKAPTALKR